MKYVDYHLPSGVDFSSITYEDIRWQYGVSAVTARAPAGIKSICRGTV